MHRLIHCIYTFHPFIRLKKDLKRFTCQSHLCMQSNFNRLNAHYLTPYIFLYTQIFVKIQTVGGTILSYATDETFAIVNDVTIKVYFGPSFFDTGEGLEPNRWNLLSVVYRRELGKLH